MRELKFRGERIDNGNLVYGGVITSNNKVGITFFDNGGLSWVYNDVHPESAGQYTGFKDRNGNEIYEGDILRTEDDVISKVSFDEASFKLVFYHNGHLINCILDKLFINKLKPTIVGNMHQNPELFNV